MLHVWLRAQHSSLAVWQADAKQWQLVDDWQQLQEHYISYKSGNDKRLCLYFPSSHLLQVDTELSLNQLKQLGDTGKQYLFEETSITPVEQLMVRQQSYASHHHLYALAKDDSDSWQQSALLAGFSIGALLPDFLLLPVPEEGAGQQVVLYQDKHTTLLRQSLQQGMAVSYLPLVVERLPHLSEICRVSAIDESVASIESPQLSAPHLLLTQIAAKPEPIDIPDRHALNFFTKTSDTKLSPYLRVAAMVALSALVLQMATDGLQAYRYNQASAATQSAIGKQFQSWFPEDRLNSRTLLQTQMQAKLRTDSQAQSAHMATLARISPLIKQSSLTAQSLVMQPSSLSFTLIAPNRSSLDEFANTLVTQGIAASLLSVNGNEQGEFSGQITVNIADNSAEAGELSSS
ncbi:type II secretion system protein GspL [uncultured Psychrobacter sp.]|uniref:type II secretion system protein GspL n=1 Tax=uncultured Psychrobacter sp. TaxID=259303 RepID=UPI00263163B5|nr:type II secretion system protein GspL [uncultured Psychrobacter sp.]